MTQYLVPGGDLIDISASTLSGTLALLMPSDMGDGSLLQFIGGTNYDVDLTEAATATDAIDAATTSAAALTEAATATDSIDAGTLFAASITEAASAADTIDAALSYGAALVEAATATDTIDGVFSYNVSLVETATATDIYDTGTTYAVSLAETALALDEVLGELFQPQFLQMTAIAGNLTVTLRGVKLTRVVEDVQIYVTRASQAARSGSPVATLEDQQDGPFEVVIPLTVSAGYLCTVQCAVTPAVASALVTAP